MDPKQTQKQGENQGFTSQKPSEERLRELFKVGRHGNKEELTSLYNELAVYYDEYSASLGKDIGAKNLTKLVCDLQQDKSSRILDVGCGNGLLGIELKDLGYTNTDGLDMAQGMLDVCKAKNVYNHYILEGVFKEKMTPGIPDNTYDVVCLNGSMAGDHVTPDCIPELARMVKPGGFIVFNIISYWQKNAQELFGLEAIASKLQEFVANGPITKWNQSRHLYFRSRDEDAEFYVLTVV